MDLFFSLSPGKTRENSKKQTTKNKETNNNKKKNTHLGQPTVPGAGAGLGPLGLGELRPARRRLRGRGAGRRAEGGAAPLPRSGGRDLPGASKNCEGLGVLGGLGGRGGLGGLGVWGLGFGGLGLGGLRGLGILGVLGFWEF